ncbi:MAG TPA: 5'/3'-nucleotidase SurE [Acidimicrobiales bacterium]
MATSGRHHGATRAAFGAVALVVALAACSSTTHDAATPGPSDQTAPATSASDGSGGSGGPLQILVTNDDGVGAAGIDAVVQALVALPDVHVTVVAPADNQSGSAGKTTAGPLTVTDATTASGYPAKAVHGYPADTVRWAIDDHGIDVTPDLVVSGINFGQNIGPTTDKSGTVGAARAAAARKIPALASSQGLGDPPTWADGAAAVLAWVAGHRDGLGRGAPGAPLLLDNLNIPTCTTGAPRGTITVPVAVDGAGRDQNAVDCTSTDANLPDDIAAFTHGYITVSTLDPVSTTGTTAP